MFAYQQPGNILENDEFENSGKDNLNHHNSNVNNNQKAANKKADEQKAIANQNGNLNQNFPKKTKVNENNSARNKKKSKLKKQTKVNNDVTTSHAQLVQDHHTLKTSYEKIQKALQQKTTQFERIEEQNKILQETTRIQEIELVTFRKTTGPKKVMLPTANAIVTGIVGTAALTGSVAYAAGATTILKIVIATALGNAWNPVGWAILSGIVGTLLIAGSIYLAKSAYNNLQHNKQLAKKSKKASIIEKLKNTNDKPKQSPANTRKNSLVNNQQENNLANATQASVKQAEKKNVEEKPNALLTSLFGDDSYDNTLFADNKSNKETTHKNTNEVFTTHSLT